MKKSGFKCFAFVLFLMFVQSANAQQKAFTIKVKNQTKMNYLLYQPENINGEAPLLVFLHGGGEGGNNIEKVKKHGPPKLIEEGREFPFYVLSPQNPYEKGFWDDQAVMKLVNKIIEKYPIDTNRIYLTGLSRGGYGAWRLAMNNPDKFAAMVVVCAASAPAVYANRIKHIPVWIFHGEKDEVVPVSESIQMADALKAVDAEVRLTLYPEANHDSWTETFNNEEVFNFLLKQTNSEKQ
jgi:predicted peptidase